MDASGTMSVERTIRIGSEELELELLPELGGRLHRLRAFGADLLRTPDDPRAYREEPFFWGGFVMAPWCNRIDAEPTLIDGRTVALEPNFADGSAIHGQVQALAWEVAGDGVLRVAAGGDGWPWRYVVEQRVAVGGATLRLSLALTNASDGPMPAGIGIHPWFLRPLEIRVAAEAAFHTNRGSSAEPSPVAGEYDLRSLRQVPPNLDATWRTATDEPILLRWPGLGVSASLRARAPGDFLCMASPTGIGAVAVEPQTQAPDGLRRLLRGEPGGLARLAPGDQLQLDLQLELGRDASVPATTPPPGSGSGPSRRDVSNSSG